MNIRTLSFFGVAFAAFFVFLSACNRKSKPHTGIMARSPEDIRRKEPDLIRSYLNEAVNKNGKFTDSTQLFLPALLKDAYEKQDFKVIWSHEDGWLPQGDSLLALIEKARYWGLFPEDYHSRELSMIQTRFFNDSNAKADRNDVSLWSTADILLTDAYFRIIKDLKLGRLGQDSLTLRKDSVLKNEYYEQQLDALKSTTSIRQQLEKLEPKQRGYQLLKAGIPKFLDSADYKLFTVVPSPTKDAAKFKKALQKRLYEGGFLATDTIAADSSQIAAGIRKFQQKKGIIVDGKAGEMTIRMLNTSDSDRFVRIAINMDKYKMLPEAMPQKYIWVNLAGYYLQLHDNDSVILTSRIVCGKPLTRTPELSSAISDMITYPQWTVPTSIIVKEILPAVKKNPGYLAKKGFSLVDRKGDEVDPFSVEWSKYSKGIPYRVVQGSGDANALGVFKFNFNNKYSVYLHDTNQRYLFGLPSRALSHGCVRVQEWQPLANYIIRNDAKQAGESQSRIDSMGTWLKRKQKHSIIVRNRIPLFIRYFTCDGKNGGIVFYDDIYGEDKLLRKQYFPGK